MAKSVSSKKSTTSKAVKKNSVKLNVKSIVSSLLDGRVKKIVGLMFILFSLLLIVAISSYIFTWQDDQDKVFNNNNLFHFLFKSNDIILNKAGRLGAWISHQMVYNGFGISSFLFGIFFSIWGLNLLLHKRTPSKRSVVSGKIAPYVRCNITGKTAVISATLQYTQSKFQRIPII
jgi:S-DNA-T family DNA segregation ATPase FtsK/SpoIIIE